MFSNRYIFIYSTIMVVVVAVLLALAATLLQPYQEKNIRIERMRYILTAINIENTTANAEELYSKYISEELVISADGEITGRYKDGKLEQGSRRAFDIDLRTEMKKLKDGGTIELPLFIAVAGNDTLTILPLQGKGLWGPIWGYISLKSDLNTIAGSVFDHKGETPGLGAEIALPEFQQQFFGKKIFDETGNFVSVKVLKGGVKNSKTPEVHGVDAISGGTITSDGTSNMIESSLHLYIPFIKKNISHE
ncbi:MAG: NADH:ubiquinone reductase (Na(+)-transporting) subunit C [Bacteroidetes bacterium GWF2_43_63]|nr:MAG: NADH:ubiquinone reductase (Na(+)-transporting) subunit C [Bacteroidetes bacterium GWE2_42_42]OFY54913.1 MAG: NADH:ubiquinone reductase (Na(+)-transporting) subunit C [Bacteroidetes bacterium GWF2_43_63]HCB63178.1 NADH:ubiquinone reductase (Na(+)-transporting) subunit C [Bacteroidales bacterium]HCY22217.1 NADH:ubiquinone reductase (Na(+)-transporting) subunit C [Bacteroidales bacterium]